jgi:hypothetical protein
LFVHLFLLPIQTYSGGTGEVSIVRSESRCALSLQYVHLVVSIEVAVEVTPPDFYVWGAAKSAMYRDRPRTLNELKTAITAF